MISVYEAILKAAARLEASPGLLDLSAVYIPVDDGARGCALGLAAYEMGFSRSLVTCSTIAAMFGLTSDGACSIVSQSYYPWLKRNYPSAPTIHDARAVAQWMREFGRRFAPAHTGIPASVRAIFTEAVQS